MSASCRLAVILACSAVIAVPATGGWAADEHAAHAAAKTPEDAHTKTAKKFVEEMKTVAPALQFDFRPESIAEIELWLKQNQDSGAVKLTPGQQRGLGCYLGEIYRVMFNGRWVGDQVEFMDHGETQRISPLQRVRARMRLGADQSLVCYTAAVRPR